MNLDEPDITHLRRAIALAEQALALGNSPFGAVAVGADGAVIAEGINSARTSGIPTEHAEVVAINTACAEAGDTALVGATMYASAEPCPMCAAALVWAGVAKVVFAATAEDQAAAMFGGGGGGAMFDISCAALIATCPAVVEVSGPHLGDEALAVSRKFRTGPGAPV